jgi:hypothetical protein
LKPGFLATEYNDGRRERYFHPARLYAFISFIFFLLFFALPDDDDSANINYTLKADKEELKEFREAIEEAGLDSLYQGVPDSVLMDSIKTGKFFRQFGESQAKQSYSLSSMDYETVEQYDSAEQAKPEGDRDGWLKRKLTIRSILLNQKYKGHGKEFSENFGEAFMNHFSQVLFFLLPFFALLLKLLYVRRNYYYSEHLVLSICYYNFFYLAASVMMLINLIPGVGFISVIIGFWIYFYLLFAMKHMYKQSWRKTIVKFVIFSWLFAFLMLIGVSINAMVTLMSI